MHQIPRRNERMKVDYQAPVGTGLWVQLPVPWIVVVDELVKLPVP